MTTNTRVTHEALTELVEIDQLYHWRDNPRRGNVKLIRASAEELGQYRPVIVNRGTHTGRPNEVLAGNHTVRALRESGWSHVSVAWVDLDSEQATKLAIADNRTGDLSEYDDRLLLEILETLPDLDGTGFDAGDLEALAASLNPPDPTPPKDFDDYDEDIEVKYGCPSCGYEWSGQPHPNRSGTHTPPAE